MLAKLSMIAAGLMLTANVTFARSVDARKDFQVLKDVVTSVEALVNARGGEALHPLRRSTAGVGQGERRGRDLNPRR